MKSDINHELAISMARVFVQEAAPEEAPLFEVTSQAYFRNRARRNRTLGANRSGPLEMGVEACLTLLTNAALCTANATLTFIALEFKKGVEEKGANAVRGWIEKIFRRITSTEETAVTYLPLTTEQLYVVRSYAYEQATAFKMSHEKAEKMADTIVGRLALYDHNA